MKKTLLALAGSTLLSFSASNVGFSKPLYPDCVNRSHDTVVLKFYGEPITSYGYAERIKLKKMLRQSCNVSFKKLQNISAITVVGESYSRRSNVWVETSNYTSHQQLIKQDTRRSPAQRRVKFFLPSLASEGKTQVLVRGDIDLKRIKVEFAAMHRRGDRYQDNNRGRDNRGRDNRGPRRGGGRR